MTKKFKIGDLVSAPLVDNDLGCFGEVISVVTKVKGDELETKCDGYSWSGEIHSVDKIDSTRIKGSFKIINTNNKLDGVLRDSKGNYHYFNEGDYKGYCKKYYKGYCKRESYEYKGYTYEHKDQTKEDFEKKLKN